MFVGVASNPSLVTKADVLSEGMVQSVLSIVPDPVFVQVGGLTADAMIKEGRRLAEIDRQRVIVKVPVTAAGIMAIHQLSEDGIPITATAICTANEELLAARAGRDTSLPTWQ